MYFPNDLKDDENNSCYRVNVSKFLESQFREMYTNQPSDLSTYLLVLTLVNLPAEQRCQNPSSLLITTCNSFMSVSQYLIPESQCNRLAPVLPSFHVKNPVVDLDSIF